MFLCLIIVELVKFAILSLPFNVKAPLNNELNCANVFFCLFLFILGQWPQHFMSNITISPLLAECGWYVVTSHLILFRWYKMKLLFTGFHRLLKYYFVMISSGVRRVFLKENVVVTFVRSRNYASNFLYLPISWNSN